MLENPFMQTESDNSMLKEPFNPVIDLKIDTKSLRLPELKLSAMELEKAREETEKIEKASQAISLDKKFQAYNIPKEIYKNIKFYKIIDYLDEGAIVFSIPVLKHFSDKKLPEGYGYKGGAARALLLRSLGINPLYQPRDIDIVRLAKNQAYEGADDEISKEFMPDDYKNGHGAEPIKDFDDYFAKRDLTINEVLATDEKIYATTDCIFDNIRHILRITKFEKYNYDSSGRIGPKMLSKILRFYAEAIERYDDASIENVEEWQFNASFISPFWLALQLDRAFEIGPKVAENFVHQLIKQKQLPENIKNANQALEYLLDIMGDDCFYFRHAPDWQYENELEWIEYFDEMGYDEDYTHLPKHSGISKSRSKK